MKKHIISFILTLLMASVLVAIINPAYGFITYIVWGCGCPVLIAYLNKTHK